MRQDETSACDVHIWVPRCLSTVHGSCIKMGSRTPEATGYLFGDLGMLTCEVTPKDEKD